MEMIFDELAKYANFHFYCEELIWNDYFDKDSFILVGHKKNSHNSFLPEVLKIKEKNKDLGIQKTLEEVLLFLIKWLTFHILDEDKRLAFIINHLSKGHELDSAIKQTDHLMNSSMKKLIENILNMYNTLSSKAIDLIRERKARIKAEEELRAINKQLQELSITDQLTSLYNRRHFENAFNIELNRCQRDKKYLGVLLFDIDYFKKLNDTYGHQQGDIALKLIAQAMKDVAQRPIDYSFRLGGEEFCIMTSSNNKEEINILATMLTNRIKELKIENKNSLVSDILTVSGGVTSIIPTKEDTIDSIMVEVDKKLYDAKNKGRNQIIL